MPNGMQRSSSDETIAVVFSGGVALGAYHAGAYAALHEAGEGLRLDWLVGASIGAVTAAIVAGNPPERRVERLRRFWDAAAADSPLEPFWPGRPERGLPWRMQGWAGALQTRLLGRPGVFRPRFLSNLASDLPGLYDLAPLRGRLEEVIDFGWLNGGDAPRLSVTATDLATGERVVFDTRRGTRIGPEHLLASCALPPDFAPVMVDGRHLGDGGLFANAPVDLVLDEPVSGSLVCFVLDLFAREGVAPRSVTDAAAGALELMFSSQSRLILEGRQREHRLRAMIGRLATGLPQELREAPEVAAVLAEGRALPATVFHLAYREAGFQKTFDFSRSTLTARWEAGACDMGGALRALAAPLRDAAQPTGLAVHEVRGGHVSKGLSVEPSA